VSHSGNRRHRRSEPPPPRSEPLPPRAASAAEPTLAALVRQLAPGTSWEQARALCRAGKVWVDGRLATDPAWRPDAGSRVEVPAAGAAPAGPAAGPATTARTPGARGRASEADADGAGDGESGLVVHADADVVVVRKPPGVLSVPFDRGDRDTLLALTRVALRRLEGRRLEGRGGGGGARHGGKAAAPAAFNPTLRAVQRLDKDTSGLLVFARNVAAQRALQEQLARGEVARRYEALVHGAAVDAVYDSWLVADRGDGLRGSSKPRPAGREEGGGAGRNAVTVVRVLEALRGATLVACELETGRQHQIRIHLAEAGHPLVGETVYVRDYAGRRIPAPRPMLHAAALGFRHPRDGRPLRFEAPPPADFAEILRRLRRHRETPRRPRRY